MQGQKVILIATTADHVDVRVLIDAGGSVPVILQLPNLFRLNLHLREDDRHEVGSFADPRNAAIDSTANHKLTAVRQP